jgi:hypothetical protein
MLYYGCTFQHDTKEEDYMRRIAFWISFIIFVCLFAFPIRKAISADFVYEGTTVSFPMSDGTTLQIEGKDVFLAAGDCGYFSLYSNSETIGSEPADKPLGVSDCKHYFTLNKRQIDVGAWQVAIGSPEFTLTSTSPIKATVLFPVGTKFAVFVVALILGLCLFVTICFIGSHFIPEDMPMWYRARKHESELSRR